MEGEVKEGETLGSIAAEIRDLLKLMVLPEIPVEPMSVIPRPKATGWDYGTLTTLTTDMKDIISYAAKTGARLRPVLGIIRTAKASNVDICLTPMDPTKSEIVAPGTTTDNGFFIHWFPYGIYTVGTSEGDRKFWARAQGITEAGKAEAVIMWE